MKKKTKVVVFKINLPDLDFLATTRLHFVRRDIDEFKKFGITEEKLVSMEQMVAELKEFPTDEEFLGEQMMCTEARDAIAVTLRVEMAGILTRAQNKFGIHSARFRRFGTARVSSLYATELLFAARKVNRVAELFLDELSGEGLTHEILRDFNALVESFSNAIDAQEDAVIIRTSGTMERVDLANQVYNTIVKICRIGKQIWASRSEAKYNDYVIYKNQPKKKKAKVEAPVTEPNKAGVIQPETGAIAVKEHPAQASPVSFPKPMNTDNTSFQNKEPGGGFESDDAD